MNDTYALVSIITVNYNGKKFIDDYFAALSKLDYPQDKLQLIFVDNGSSDGSVDYVREKFPSVVIIENPQNNYAGGNNLGLKKAQGDFIAFLNNDTKVHPQWLKELMAGFSIDPKIGVVGGKLLFMDGRLQSAGHIQYPDFQWLDRGFGEDDEGQYDIMTEMPSLCGGAVLYRRACLEDIGNMDEDLNMFLEDVDMAKRCHDKGWQLFYMPKSMVYHHYHGVMTKELEQYYVQRNRLLMVAKYWPKELPRVIVTLRDYVRAQAHTADDDIERMIADLFIKLLKTHSRSKCVAFIPDVVRALRECLTEHVGILKNVLNEVEGHSADLQALLEEKESALLVKEQEIREREELFMTSIADFQRLIQKQNAELCRVQAALFDSGHSLAESSDVSQEYIKQMAQKNETIRALQAEVVSIKLSIEETVQKYTRAIEENNGTINDFQNKLRAKEGLMDDLIKDMERERASLSDKIKSLEADLSGKISEIEQLQGRCKKFEALLKEEVTRTESEHVTVIQELTEQLKGEKALCEREYVAMIQELTERLNQEKVRCEREHVMVIGQLKQQLEEEKTRCEREHIIVIEQLKEQLRQEKDYCEREHVGVLKALTAQLQENEDIFRAKMYDFGERMRGMEEKLAAKAKELENALMEMGRTIKAKDEQVRDLEGNLWAMGNTLQSKDERVQQLEQEMSRTLILKENEIRTLHAELHEIDRLASEKENEIVRLKEQISAFFTSRGYRFILKPILNIVEPVKRILSKK